MAGILVVGEVAPDGSLTKLSTEVATLARQLGDAGAGAVTGLVAAPKPEAAAETLASFLPTVLTDAKFTDGGTATQVAAAIADLDPEGADLVMLPASPEGRDLAGALSAMTGRGVLANATDVRWDDGAVSTHSVLAASS
jgi:electron transfer flavoprotein alpha subunit